MQDSAKKLSKRLRNKLRHSAQLAAGIFKRVIPLAESAI